MSLIQDYNKLFEQNSNITKIYNKGSVVWPVVKPSVGPDYTMPFYVENITDEDETLSIVQSSSSAPSLTIEYSTDKSTWDTLGTTSTTALTRTITPGERVYLRCRVNAWSASSRYNTIQGVSKVGGNIMSLLYGSSFTGEETSFPSGSTYSFYNLFNSNTRLVSASGLLLPVTTMTNYCYHGMFWYCSSLTSAPALPATTLATRCYHNLFRECASLTQAPALPATTIKFGCYESMFYGCTSLIQAPDLPGTNVEVECYNEMFYNCTSLVSAPTLLTTSLTNYCYQHMFHGCTSLNKVTCLATTGINVGNSTGSWLADVSSTGTFTKAAGTTWPSGSSGIPSGWTVIEA